MLKPSKIDEAQEILSQKSSGPSGVLAYMLANTSEVVKVSEGAGAPYLYSRPFVDEGMSSPLVPYYAVVETDRSGLTVTTPPGGTQDIFFDLDGQRQFAELAKPSKQKELIKEITGIAVDQISDSDFTDEIFVAYLLDSDRTTSVHLESAFDAAVRETEEEQGWNFKEARNARRIFDTEEELFSKRSFVTDPPTPITQNVVVVETDTFDDTRPRYTAKTETKITAMLGNHFYEQGTFLSLGEIEDSLARAEARLSKGDLPEIAHQDYQAAVSRVEMIERIEAELTPSF